MEGITYQYPEHVLGLLKEEQITRCVWSQKLTQTDGKRENQRIEDKLTGNREGSSGP